MEKKSDNNWQDMTTKLDSDRLISIFVRTGDDAKVFKIQQALLESVSDYFVKALRNEHLGDTTRAGVLRLPEDRVDSWQVLSYWMLRRKLPANSALKYPLLAVRCCILGDKYGIEDFQDEAMLALLQCCEKANVGFGLIKEGVLNSTPGSPLRRLMIELLVPYVYEDGHHEQTSYQELDVFDGRGYMSEFLEAHDSWTEQEEDFGCFFDEDERWRTFLVGNWLESHWMFDMNVHLKVGKGE
ncbi:hypothetical protein LTR85_005223 [Meristemomyces frigidus]|nr:hypothetical protein LTR85_005223 [Meristemomyces frigidus]